MIRNGIEIADGATVDAIHEAYNRGISDGHPLAGRPKGVVDIIEDLAKQGVVDYRQMLADAVKYAREDGMVTPGSTRLARLLARAEAAITRETP